MIRILYVAFYNADICVCLNTSVYECLLFELLVCVLDHCTALVGSVWMKQSR